MLYIEELPLHQQDATPHCFSCGRVVPSDYLRICLVCRDPICSLAECSKRCACDDFHSGLMDIGELLANRWGATDPVIYHKLLLQEVLLQNAAPAATV